MIPAPMCATVFRVPRCKVHSLVNTWWNGFDSLCIVGKERHNFRLLSSTVCEQGASKRWSRRSITTKGEVKSETVLSSAVKIRHGVTDKVVTSVITNLNIQKIDDTQLKPVHCKDVRKLVAEDKNLTDLATFIVFDLETTGISRDESIIEIGLVDIHGGENSTFETLVNPGRIVRNAEIHGITTKMVSEPSVPRMTELIPILLQFIKSREKPGGFVVMVAHNARSFDVPFLVNEFTRCSFDIPSNWVFLDTLPIARAVLKSRGENTKGMVNLRALCDRYEVKLEDAHRAMADVCALTLVFKNLSEDLKLTKANLIVDWSFTANDLSVKKAVNDLNGNSAKKKNESS